MTTATGDYALNYAPLGNANPFAHADFDAIGTGVPRILSGVFRWASGASSRAAHRYNGAVGAGNIASKIEFGAAGGGGDSIAAIIVDTNGDGYAALCTAANAISLVRLDNLAVVDYLASGTPTAGNGNVVELRLNQTTHALSVYIDGVSASIGATDATVTAGLSPGLMVVADNTGNATVISFAADGVVLGPTIVSVDDSTPADGGTLVITCTNAGAVEGSVTIDGVAQQVDAWADDEITITLSDIRCFYNTNVDLIIVDSDDNASPAEVIQVTPPAGWDVVTFGTLADPADRVVWSPDLETGWQGAWGDVVGGTVNDMAWLDDGSLAYSEALTSCMLKVNDGTQWLAAESFYFVGSGRGLALDLSRDLSRDLSTDLSA